MDDAQIKQLTEEVLSQLRGGGGGGSSGAGDLEGRVAALEAAVRALQAGPSLGSRATAVVVAQAGAPHAAFGLLGPGPGGDGRCVVEPDKPCVQSGQCRGFGH